MRCKENSGILFNHPCDQAAAMSCTQCSKPICDRHMRHHEDKPVCTSCVRTVLKERRDRGESLSGAYRNDPYFFYYFGSWGHDPYDDDDYALFDAGDEGGYEMADDGAWVGS